MATGGVETEEFEYELEEGEDMVYEYLIDADISQGLHSRPIPCVSQDPDDEAPEPFHYVTSYHHPVKPSPHDDEPFVGTNPSPKIVNANTAIAPIQHYKCNCTDGCTSYQACTCQQTHRVRPFYNSKGLLIFNDDPQDTDKSQDELHATTSEKPPQDQGVLSQLWQTPQVPMMVYECNEDCACAKNPNSCGNRVSQKPIPYDLHIFKSEKTGWGVRSSDFIPRGAFIGIYAGELVARVDDPHRKRNPTYFFGVDDRYVVDARRYGNYTRFLNHSCSPNLHAIRIVSHMRPLDWQLNSKSRKRSHDEMESEDSSKTPQKERPWILARIGFYAIEDIPPFTELTINYGPAYWLKKYDLEGYACQCDSSRCWLNENCVREGIRYGNRLIEQDMRGKKNHGGSALDATLASNDDQSAQADLEEEAEEEEEMEEVDGYVVSEEAEEEEASDDDEEEEIQDGEAEDEEEEEQEVEIEEDQNENQDEDEQEEEEADEENLEVKETDLGEEDPQQENNDDENISEVENSSDKANE